MDDLISRSALLDDIRKTIDASGCVNHEGEMLGCIRYASAVDAVIPVRCKDCKHFYEPDINPNRRCKRGGSQVWDVEFRADDFCSYGERKEGAD